MQPKNALVYASITFIAAINGTSASLPLTALLIALLLWQTASDLEDRFLFTPLALAIELTISLSIAIPGAVAASLLDRAQLVIPVALVVATFVYSVCIVAIMASQRFHATQAENTINIFVFPLLWAICWALFCRVHSLGRLVSWTPLLELSLFYSFAVAFGMPGLDFLTALMAVTILELLGGVQQLAPEPTLLIDDEQPTERSHLLPVATATPHTSKENRRSKLRSLILVSFLLAWWSISGIVTSNSVSPVSATEGAIKLACILPPFTTKTGHPIVADYLAETEIVSGRGAKILQWPEAAVHLTSIAEKNEFVKGIKALAVRRRAFLAPSYTAYAQDKDDTPSILSTLIGPDGEEIYTYVKQALVPVAETYRYLTGTRSLPHAQRIFIPDAHQHGRTSPKGQNVTISTAICHDTSFDHILRQAYPSSLLLVPSSVYSERIAWTRINQLRVHARALSTSVLVCDANKQGISAFIDSFGHVRYWQKGPGSFEMNAQVQQTGRTGYGAYGDGGALAILFACFLAILGFEVLASRGLRHLHGLLIEAWHTVRHRITGTHYDSTSSHMARQQTEDLL